MVVGGCVVGNGVVTGWCEVDLRVVGWCEVDLSVVGWCEVDLSVVTGWCEVDRSVVTSWCEVDLRVVTSWCGVDLGVVGTNESRGGAVTWVVGLAPTAGRRVYLSGGMLEGGEGFECLSVKVSSGSVLRSVGLGLEW